MGTRVKPSTGAWLSVLVALKPWQLLPWLGLSEYPPSSVIDPFQAQSLQTTLSCYGSMRAKTMFYP